MKTCDPNDAGVEVNGNAERVMGKREEEEKEEKEEVTSETERYIQPPIPQSVLHK